MSVVAHPYNPRAEEVESGGFLGLAGQPAWTTCQAADTLINYSLLTLMKRHGQKQLTEEHLFLLCGSRGGRPIMDRKAWPAEQKGAERAIWKWGKAMSPQSPL